MIPNAVKAFLHTKGALTDRVIEQALEVKAGEAEEQQQAAPQLPPQEHQGSLL